MTTESDSTSAPLIDPDAVGVEVSWSFGDGDAEAVALPRSTVIDLFERYNFDVAELTKMDPTRALRRAAHYAHESQSISVRQLARPNRNTPRAFGIYERVTREGESGDRWVCGARVRVSGNTIECLPPEGAEYLDKPKRIGLNMAALANRLLGEVMNVDISNALTAAGHSLVWISRRRNSGGVYLMLRNERAERFVNVLRELASMTAHCGRRHRFYPQIQEVYPKPLTQESWRESARNDIETDLKGLVESLRKMRDNDSMREKTKNAHADAADALIAKAEHYRDFLGSIASDLAGELSMIRDTFRRAASEGVDAIRSDLDAILATDGRQFPGEGNVEEEATEAPTPTPEPETVEEAVPAAPQSNLSREDRDLFDF